MAFETSKTYTTKAVNAYGNIIAAGDSATILRAYTTKWGQMYDVAITTKNGVANYNVFESMLGELLQL